MDIGLLEAHHKALDSLSQEIFAGRQPVLASNRGPVDFSRDQNGGWIMTRGPGGLVTAMSAMTRYNPLWVAAPTSTSNMERAAEAGYGPIEAGWEDKRFTLRYVKVSPDDYDAYYNTISNPLLWFLQHYMWDAPRTPTIDADVWAAWGGYLRVNQSFADTIAHAVAEDPRPPIIMLQDYHLYLTPGILRPQLPSSAVLSLFIHIPWPGPDYWALLPQEMREAILRSLCACDILGFHTRRYQRNFLTTCRAYLPDVEVDMADNWVRLDGHTLSVRVYPISIDVAAVRQLAESPEVRSYRHRLRGRLGDQTIVRIDRAEPSKNIVRGFDAFELLLQRHPEYIGRLKFLVFLVPSRLRVEEYQRYLEEIFIKVGWINTRYGTSDWQPIETFVGDNYERAIAAMQLYDVLLVNPIIDGMNLVAKEGPTVNENGGVLVLSEGAGAFEQLGEGALVVSPTDIVGTAEALHEALQMPLGTRYRRLRWLREQIESEDITMWLYHQLDDIKTLLEQRGEGEKPEERVIEAE